MYLNELKNKRILVLGFGKEGKDNYLALRKLFPEKILAIADKLELEELLKGTQELLEKDKNLKLHLGKNYLKALKNYDLVIKTPGIPLKTIKPFLNKDAKVTSQTEIFFEYCPGKIIGVTGTKGKGTTSSLIYRILKKGGLKVHLIGNIGRPVFQTLLRAKKTPFSSSPSLLLGRAKTSDIFVYEISSHQLQTLKKSPFIAVFLNLYPDHLDYYKNFKEYCRAKESIARYQTKKDYFIYNSEQKLLREIAEKSKAKRIPIPTNYEFLTNIRIPLTGKFNLQNIMAAVTVGKIFGVSDRKIIQTIENFKPLPHRLEFVGKYKGVEFYNDSFATIPQATIAALDALGKRVKTLILGGSSKRETDFPLLAKKILKSKIENLILFPDTGKEIWEALRLASPAQGKKLPKSFFVRSMPEAVKIAYQCTKKSGICLLSPASASFSLFRNYKERGNLFKKYIRSER
jgi:UDP-N-acetylmuramoylalanine--D-glutamate ligase